MSAAPREPEPFVALDLETTGLFAETDRVVEVGAVRVDAEGREVDRFARLVHPGRPMSPAAEAVHGISDADLADAPPASEVLPAFLAWLGDPIPTLVAHNAAFDAGFLGRELGRLGLPAPARPIADTLSLARARLPEAPDHRLDTLARLLGLDAGEPHRALADGRRVAGVWLALGGPTADPPPAAYPIRVPAPGGPVPAGWAPLAEAIAAGRRVRLAYTGGTRGPAPREVSPRRFAHKGGLAYLVAFCHLDRFEKSFRLDRVAGFEVLGPDARTDLAGAGRPKLR